MPSETKSQLESLTSRWSDSFGPRQIPLYQPAGDDRRSPGTMARPDRGWEMGLPGLEGRASGWHSCCVISPTQPVPTATPRRRGPRVGTILAGLIAVSMIGMWVWVFAFHLGGTWRDQQPGQLDDPTFAVAAEPVCAATMSELAQLPPAWETDTPATRSDAIDESVVILNDMVAELSTLPTGTDQEAVDEWIADWQTYVEDRADYAKRLRADPSARFYVTQSDRDRRQITLAIDKFAETNAMPSCETPADLS